MHFEFDYFNIMKSLQREPQRSTRNAITQAAFGKTLQLPSMAAGYFPLLNGRKLFYKGVIGEMAAFLKGPKTLKDFEDQGCNYWSLWSKKDGGISVDYGNSWLDFNGVNQLSAVVDSLKNDPYGRRHVISGWNPANLATLDLPCCHYAYQWFVNLDGTLDMLWHQRSADWMIGVPSDIILAAVFNALMAKTTGYLPGRITMTFGDTHLYESHEQGMDTYEAQFWAYYKAERAQPEWFPSYSLDPDATLFNFTPNMIHIHNYNPAPAVKFHLEK